MVYFKAKERKECKDKAKDGKGATNRHKDHPNTILNTVFDPIFLNREEDIVSPTGSKEYERFLIYGSFLTFGRFNTFLASLEHKHKIQ